MLSRCSVDSNRRVLLPAPASIYPVAYDALSRLWLLAYQERGRCSEPASGADVLPDYVVSIRSGLQKSLPACIYSNIVRKEVK